MGKEERRALTLVLTFGFLAVDRGTSMQLEKVFGLPGAATAAFTADQLMEMVVVNLYVRRALPVTRVGNLGCAGWGVSVSHPVARGLRGRSADKQ